MSGVLQDSILACMTYGAVHIATLQRVVAIKIDKLGVRDHEFNWKFKSDPVDYVGAAFDNTHVCLLDEFGLDPRCQRHVHLGIGVSRLLLLLRNAVA